MSPPQSISYNELLALQAVSLGCVYGLEIMERTGLSAGTVYPILRRLEAHGWLASSREDEESAHAEGRPARRLLELTGPGQRVLARGRDELHARHAALGLLPGSGGQ